MDVLRVALLAVVTALLAVLLKAAKREEFALMAALAAGVILLIYIVGRLSGVLTALDELARRGNIDGQVFTTVLKVISVAYIAEFGAQLCRDADQGALALKVELGGKVGILLLSIPVLTSLMDLILRLVP